MKPMSRRDAEDMGIVISERAAQTGEPHIVENARRLREAVETVETTTSPVQTTVKKINQLHRNVVDSVIRTAKDAAEIGLLLAKLKNEAGHNYWEKDFKSFGFDFSIWTARRYMKWAEFVKTKTGTVPDLTLTKAYKAAGRVLAPESKKERKTIKTKTEPATPQELINRAKEVQTGTEILAALELRGIAVLEGAHLEQLSDHHLSQIGLATMYFACRVEHVREMRKPKPHTTAIDAQILALKKQQGETVCPSTPATPTNSPTTNPEEDQNPNRASANDSDQ